MAGLGQAPFGNSIFGYGLNAQAPILSNHILEDQQGFTKDARFINPFTGDYSFDTDNTLQGMSSVAQQVYLALMTQYNSSVLNGFGNQFFSIRQINSGTAAQVKNFIYSALNSLISQNIISIIETNSIANFTTGLIAVSVTWQDNTTGQTQTTNIGQG